MPRKKKKKPESSVKTKPAVQPRGKERETVGKVIPYIFLAAILIFITIIRIRLLSFPLERDEGEYAYFGQLILDGISPYMMAFNLKLPGTYYSYAMIMALFGQTREGIHLGLLVFNLGSAIFLFLIGRKLFNNFVAMSACAVFAVLVVSPSLLGYAAHATHFVSFFMLAGIYVLLSAFDKHKWALYFLSGILLGLSFIMKQSGLFFTLFGGLMIILYYLVHKHPSLSRSFLNLVIYGAGSVIPLGVVFLVMALSGVFEKFWFWTFIYPGVYGSRIPVSEIFDMLKITLPPVFSAFVACWVLAGLGIPALFLYRGKSWARIFLGMLLLFSILPVIPGFFFRQHYFIPLIPALGLMAGLFLDTVNQWIKKYFKRISWVTGILLVVLLVAGINKRKAYFYELKTGDLAERTYFGNPFLESIQVAKYLKSRTKPDDRILVFGSEPQIYFYADRKSSTGYIYMYDLAFKHPYLQEMQDELMSDIELNKPEYAVFVNCTYSWSLEKESSDTLFVRFNNFLRENNYTITGVADMQSPGNTVYKWDEEAAGYIAKSQKFLMIFKRGSK
ncbi:MAG: glycosyltransferase family 39 protein [Bacteroidia bacterium]|nr:glycosyltransferase family 39 protein [Bacteroidia bacterium]